jgi:hypothetical protein
MWVYGSFATKGTKPMITYLGHWLRANKGSSRLGLPAARFEKFDNLIHGLKPVATNSEPLWGSSKNAKLSCTLKCVHIKKSIGLFKQSWCWELPHCQLPIFFKATISILLNHYGMNFCYT